MRSPSNPYAAIIDLKDPIVPTIKAMIESVLGVASGVRDVRVLMDRPRIVLSFDGSTTALGDIVATIERHGWPVRMVAQRRISEPELA